MKKRQREGGFAMVMAVLALMVILGALAVVMYRVQAAKRNADEAVYAATADEALKAGIDMVVERVWNDYLTGQGNTTGNLASYRMFIDNIVPNSEDANGDGELTGNEWDADGDGMADTANGVELFTANEAYTLPNGARITQLAMRRSDDLTGVNLWIDVTARMGHVERSATQTLRIGGELFQGFEYGILANNINCILCHARFESLDLFLNGDASDNFGDFDRIKVAALESLLVRPNGAHSTVAGTVYTRGIVTDDRGNPMSASELGSSTFKSVDFSQDNGKIIQNAGGDMIPANLANAGTNAEGKLMPFENLYMNYPTDPELMTDGNLPQSFPAPYPDDNNNRVVDDDEFQQVVNSATGYITFELPPDQVSGSITAGVAYGVPDGSAYAGGGLPPGSNAALQSLSNNGAYDGNLILAGTEHDPISISGRVAVDGDLVIKGPVKGWGQILVRGNVYVVGDVTYADDGGQYATAADGTTNGLAITAGGSIMMGDYTTIRAKQNHGDNGTWQGKFIDTRQAHKTVTCRDGSTTDVGYFDDGVVDAGYPVGDEDQISFTTSELMLFNRMEYQKAQNDPSYTPRYYRLRPDQPIYQYVGNDEHTVHYNDPDVEIIADLDGATIHDLNPTNFWLSEDQLREFWWNDEMSRPDSGRPFLFDGLLYSNNSIFGITRSKGRHNSNTYGQMIVRGSIVTSDLGMLVPGPDFSVPREGLVLYYDPRVAAFLRVEDTTRVDFRRVAFRYRSQAQVNADADGAVAGGDTDIATNQEGGGEEDGEGDGDG